MWSGHLQIHWVPNWSREFHYWESVHFPIRRAMQLKEEVGSGRVQRYENTFKVKPKGPVRIPRVIANTVSVETDLMWIDERAM